MLEQTEREKLRRIEQKIPSLIVISTKDDTPYRNARYRVSQFKKREPEKFGALLSEAARILDDFDRESRGAIKRADETLAKFYRNNRAAAHIYTTAIIFYVAFATVVATKIVLLLV